MSREWNGDGSSYPYELWDYSLARALHGPRARRTLQGLIDALEALPVHELAEGTLCEVPREQRDRLKYGENDVTRFEEHDNEAGRYAPMAPIPWALPGMVCAMGAMGLAKGWDAARLVQIEDHWWSGLEASVRLGEALGIARTVGTLISETNDVRRYDEDPVKRWTRMRAWAERMLDESKKGSTP